jgi:serine/threonine protein kinase
MSPEICSKNFYDGLAADMWAAGILLYTMLFGQQPFKASTEKDLFKKIIKGQYSIPSIVKVQVEYNLQKNLALRSSNSPLNKTSSAY